MDALVLLQGEVSFPFEWLGDLTGLELTFIITDQTKTVVQINGAGLWLLNGKPAPGELGKIIIEDLLNGCGTVVLYEAAVKQLSDEYQWQARLCTQTGRVLWRQILIPAVVNGV